MWPAWHYAKNSFANTPLPITPERRNSYLAQQLPSYPAYQLLNRTRGHDYALYAFGDTNMSYYADGRFMGDWFGPARFSDFLPKLQDPAAFYNALKMLGVNFFLIEERDFRPNSVHGDQNFFAFLDDPFFDTHFKIIFARPYFMLFQVLAQTSTLSQRKEWLRNGGFEELQVDKTPQFWIPSGKPIVDVGGLHAFHGKIGVRADEHNYWFQRLPVEQNEVYLLRHSTFSDHEKQHARLQINWLDAEMKTIVRGDIEVVETGPHWRSHVMLTQTPAHARWADVYVSVHDGSDPVWFDDLSLASIKQIPEGHFP